MIEEVREVLPERKSVELSHDRIVASSSVEIVREGEESLAVYIITNDESRMVGRQECACEL